MGEVFITGDTHGEMDMKKLSFKNWPEGAALTRNDYVIIAGDFGLIFYPTPTPAEMWWLRWLEDRPFTVLFIDGNHDNHHRLAELPKVDMFNGTVGKVADNIYHLKRGEVYEIHGKKILTFGGASSIDKNHRIENVSWWREEIPSYAEMDKAIQNVTNNDNKVDYIIAHTCPSTLAHIMIAKYGLLKDEDPTCSMLEHLVTMCEFEGFYCGHWHVDVDLGKYHFMYDRILPLV